MPNRAYIRCRTGTSLLLFWSSGGWVKVKLNLPYQIHIVFRCNPRSRCNNSSCCCYRAREHVVISTSYQKLPFGSTAAVPDIIVIGPTDGDKLKVVREVFLLVFVVKCCDCCCQFHHRTVRDAEVVGATPLHLASSSITPPPRWPTHRLQLLCQYYLCQYSSFFSRPRLIVITAVSLLSLLSPSFSAKNVVIHSRHNDHTVLLLKFLLPVNSSSDSSVEFFVRLPAVYNSPHNLLVER